MFFPEGQVRVHLYGRPVDLRRSFDGLYALTRHELDEDPISGALFVFINRRATRLKVLYWDRTGFRIWAKRLEQGRFVSDWTRVATREMGWTGLKLLLQGIEPRVVALNQPANAIVQVSSGFTTRPGRIPEPLDCMTLDVSAGNLLGAQ